MTSMRSLFRSRITILRTVSGRMGRFVEDEGTLFGPSGPRTRIEVDTEDDMHDRSMVLRPLRMGADSDRLNELAAVAFAEDYQRMGERVQAVAKRERWGARVLGALSRLSPSLRDANQGLVLENGKRIASVVLFGRNGAQQEHWTIEAVATHPDYHRKGMARRLVTGALERIRKAGGTLCTLKVREDNDPAYKLYRDLGFRHYDTTRHMKRGEKCVLPSCIDDTPIDGMRSISMKEWFALWRERCDLARRATSEGVAAFAPIRPAAFRRSRILLSLAPLLMRIGGFDVRQWGVFREGQLVASVRVRADTTGNRPHEIKLVIDRDFQDRLAGSLVDCALGALAAHPITHVLMEARESDPAILAAMRERGFEGMSTWHWLGTKPEEALA